jgi:hypothetical protein
MIVDCGERMLRMLQIAQRRLQVLSDPRARLLSHTDAAALVNCPDNRRARREESPGMAAPFFPQCVSSVSPLERLLTRQRRAGRCPVSVLVAGDGDRRKLELLTKHQLVEKPSQQFS